MKFLPALTALIFLLLLLATAGQLGCASTIEPRGVLRKPDPARRALLDPETEYTGLCREQTFVVSSWIDGPELALLVQEAVAFWNTIVGRDVLVYGGMAFTEDYQEEDPYIVFEMADLETVKKLKDLSKKLANGKLIMADVLQKTIVDRKTSLMTKRGGGTIAVIPFVPQDGPTKTCTLGGKITYRYDQHLLRSRTDTLIIHELGHILGLTHTTKRPKESDNTIMSWVMSRDTDLKKDLDPKTIAEIEFLYGDAQNIILLEDLDTLAAWR